MWNILSSAAYVVVLGVVIPYVLNSLAYKRRMRGALPIPGPKALPLLGNLFDLPADSQFIPVFNKWHRQYGDIVAFRVLGETQIVLNTEKAANELMVMRGNDYSHRGVPTAVKDISRGMVTALMDRNENWRRHRKLLHTMLSGPATARYEPFIVQETVSTLADLLDSPQNFSDHIERYAFGILYRIAFGRRVRSLSDPVVQQNIASTDDLLSTFRPDKFACNIFPPLIHAPDWLVPSNRTVQKYKANIASIIASDEAEVRGKMKAGTAPPSLKKFFLEHVNEFGLSEEEGAWMFQALVAAGTRSPYNAVMGYVIQMLQNPEWQRRTQEEIERVVGPDRLPGFEDLPKLPMVRAVVKESIRMRSIEAEIGIPHKAAKDDVYEGYFIPKGAILHANSSAILSDRKLYPDGPVFNPARWLDPSYPTYKGPLDVHPSLQGYTSFGYGRRACPGASFTDCTMTLMIARLAWAFDIRRAVDPDTGVEIPLHITYEPVPNPKPFPFPAVFVARGEKRSEIIREVELMERNRDPVLKE